jgi:hypothetical protein
MKRYRFIIRLCLITTIIFSACQDSNTIIRLLSSEKKDDLILGAYMAGESEKKEYVPYLLRNTADIRTSTQKKFLGYNVYQEKMIALKKIFKREPPKKITDKPDSVIIKFYMSLPR